MKKLIGGGLAALALGLVGCSATGGAPSMPTVPLAAPTTTTPSWLHPVVTAPPASSLKYYVGEMAQNGSLRFRVDTTRRSTQACNQFICYHPGSTGYEFFIVQITVQNVDTHPVFFYNTSQTLVLHGQQVSVDISSTSALSVANPVIQPGLAISDTIAFVVPEGAQPEAVMLSDALASIADPTVAATRVELVTP